MRCLSTKERPEDQGFRIARIHHVETRPTVMCKCPGEHPDHSLLKGFDSASARSRLADIREKSGPGGTKT